MLWRCYIDFGGLCVDLDCLPERLGIDLSYMAGRFYQEFGSPKDAGRDVQDCQEAY